MDLCFSGDIGAFNHLLDHVNPATWAIELITKDLISGACRCAETTVHATTQNFLCDLASGGAGITWSERGFHANKSVCSNGLAYRPG
jgi:hypothetical protein